MANLSQDITYTSREEVDAKLSTLRQTFKSGRTKSLAWRKWQLKQFWWMVADNEQRISQALAADLNRHEFESFATDILGLKNDILDHIEHLEEWTAEENPKAGFLMGTLGKARIRKEPLGVALIIGAWNFPFLLILQPMIAAIAAGCTVMLKPSELSRTSETALVEMIAKYLDESAYTIVTGGPQETGYILSKKFDHIFFTGSPGIARHVAAAAAKHLTPTVLELGGQGPAIVTKTANLDLAAKRIAYAKFINAGQICLSVNHVFVDPSVHEEFVSKVVSWNEIFSGGKEQQSQMGRIVNDRNYDRLQGLLDKTQGKVVYGGSGDRAALKLRSTVIDNVTMQDSLLSAELFGPLLPIVVADYKEATRIIGDMPHPLAIYIFSTSSAEIDYVLDHSLSGGCTINDVMMHAGVHGAPFGGVGESGYGYYHGKHGLDAFCHTRTIVAPPLWLDKLMAFRYPPFNIKNKSKLQVKNRLGFVKGERLEDQKIRKPGRNVPWAKLFSMAMVLMWFVDSKVLKDRLGFAPLLRTSAYQLVSRL